MYEQGEVDVYHHTVWWSGAVMVADGLGVELPTPVSLTSVISL